MGGGVTPTKKTLAAGSLYLVGLTLYESAVPSRPGRWYVLVSTSSNGTAQLVRSGANSSSGIWVLGSQPDKNTVASPAVLSRLNSSAVGAFSNVVAALREQLTNHVSDRWRTMTEGDTSSTFNIDGGLYLGQELSVVSRVVPVAGSLMAIQSQSNSRDFFLGCKMSDGSRRLLRFQTSPQVAPYLAVGSYLDSDQSVFGYLPSPLPFGDDTTPPGDQPLEWSDIVGAAGISEYEGIKVIDARLTYEGWAFVEDDHIASYYVGVRVVDSETNIAKEMFVVPGDVSPAVVAMDEDAES